jgi:hypothetical protein
MSNFFSSEIIHSWKDSCTECPFKCKEFQKKILDQVWSQIKRGPTSYLQEKSTKLFLIFPEILSYSLTYHTNEQTSNQLTFTSLSIAKGEEASEISKLANLDLCNFTKLSLSSHFKGG